ncbi:F-box protein PP2-B15-like [Malania oleifera]|uniref:F-box protein PP2-B15-like n=1 Tax=Malania oleifera TaxID=397392 RepID=UPI0025AE2C52|nr:F-box protein PP2-B15-like [Malania oleifera]
MGCSDVSMLPKDCISAILSLTSPADASRSAMVSAAFRSAADSDLVWDKFLPSDYRQILSRYFTTTPLKFSSKRELYSLLCHPNPIDAGNKILRLEKWTGKKSYILSARELSIAWGNDPLYWCWKSIPQSRFPEAVELRTICWLEIHGKIKTQMLSPNTTYGAYLILKISNRAFGLDSIPSQVSVEVGNIASTGAAYLRRHDDQKGQMEGLFYSNRMQMLRSRVVSGDGVVQKMACEREDGWMEIELGEFFINGDEGCDEVKMSLMEVKGHHLKGGLIIEGIEVRPK